MTESKEKDAKFLGLEEKEDTLGGKKNCGISVREVSFSLLLLSCYPVPDCPCWALKDSEAQFLSSGGLSFSDRVK